MVYEWEQHKDVCYRLYIQERKSLEEIMQHMRDNFNFTPSKRAFQTQFRRWDFPSKQNPAHRNVDLVSRVKELWEQNYSQRDMLKTLNNEGHEIKERELMRVRAKNRWLLRIPNGAKPMATDFSEVLESATARKRKERHDQLQAESDERWASKKRRRRTREYAGIAADPPGPPRFPSETTLAESMAFLGMDKKGYKEVRDHFQRICEEEAIVKKTTAGPEKWQAAKSRLVQENTFLVTAFDGTNQQPKELALDVICTDVTKRMRTTERRMTIVDSKNALGINPEQSRQIRNSFYQILQNNHFTSKLETGHEHWQDLKSRWIESTPLLQQLLEGEHDDNGALKTKALEVLCRDVMKRLRDDQKRKDGPTSATFDEDFQIDPSLLLPDPPKPTAVYIRPHPLSQVHNNDKMWLASLTSRHVSELYGIVTRKWPETTVTRIDGIEKDGDGQEVSYLIEEDEELDAYLDHVRNRKAVFVVQLH